jgi:hypothetical protein
VSGLKGALPFATLHFCRGVWRLEEQVLCFAC